MSTGEGFAEVPRRRSGRARSLPTLDRVTRQQRLTLVATILGSTVVFLDSTVVNVALPAISDGPRRRARRAAVGGRGLHAHPGLAAAGRRLARRPVRPAADVRLRADRLRRRPRCSARSRPTVEFLIGARALQGIAGALLVPGSLAIVAATFEGAARGKAVGTWTAWTGIATVLGPAGGGALIGLISWRAIFWVNLPLIAATVALTLHSVEESRDPDAFRGIDWPGIVLSAVGLGGPVFALIEQPTHGWGDPLVWVAAASPASPASPSSSSTRRAPATRCSTSACSGSATSGRQPDHARRLRRADRRPLLRRPLPPAGRRLLAARGRPGDDADLDPDLLPLAALRQASPPAPARGCR